MNNKRKTGGRSIFRHYRGWGTRHQRVNSVASVLYFTSYKVKPQDLGEIKDGCAFHLNGIRVNEVKQNEVVDLYLGDPLVIRNAIRLGGRKTIFHPPGLYYTFYRFVVGNKVVWVNYWCNRAVRAEPKEEPEDSSILSGLPPCRKCGKETMVNDVIAPGIDRIWCGQCLLGGSLAIAHENGYIFPISGRERIWK